MRIGNETFLHCISDGKMKKEQAIVNKARDAMEQEIEYLSEGLTIKRRLNEIVSEGSGTYRPVETTLQQGLKGILH